MCYEKPEKKIMISNLVGNNRCLVHVVVDGTRWRRGASTRAHMKPFWFLGRPLGGYPRREAQGFRPLRQTTHHLFFFFLALVKFHRCNSIIYFIYVCVNAARRFELGCICTRDYFKGGYANKVEPISAFVSPAKFSFASNPRRESNSL